MMNKALNYLGRLLCVGVILVGAASLCVGYYSTSTDLLTAFSQYPRLHPWLLQAHLHHQQLITDGVIAVVLAFLCGFTLLLFVGKIATHGSAKWAGFWECLFARLMPLRGPRFRLGRRSIRNIALPSKLQREHVIIMAPSGQFKTSGFIEPNLFEERGERGLVIFDIKGELLKTCGGALSTHLKVVAFAPMDLSISIHYNPLRHIMADVDAEDLATC